MERTFEVKMEHLRADAFRVPVEYQPDLAEAISALDWSHYYASKDIPDYAKEELRRAARCLRYLVFRIELTVEE